MGFSRSGIGCSETVTAKLSNFVRVRGKIGPRHRIVTKYGPQHKSSIFRPRLSDPENQSGETVRPFARILSTRHNGRFEVESYACPDDIFTEVQPSHDDGCPFARFE